jgi:penicillin-binding protein 1A
VRRVVWGGLAALAIGALGAGGTAWWMFHTYGKEVPDAPELAKWRPPILSEAYSADEVLLAEFFRERRKIVPYERIPKKLIQAFIASEDAKFFDHHGFDVAGIAGAAFRNVAAGRIRGGGSTITQQTAKALLIEAEGYEKGTEKTIRRKLKELVLALELEKKLTKEEILWLYLNNVYLGHHSYGVQSAAENYFRKNVEDLTLPEMALIAGLPQAPSRYSPFSRPEAAAARRRYVVRRMFEEGMISAEERQVAEDEPVQVHGVEDVFGDTAPFFAEHLRRDIVARYGNERMLTDGLQVWASMDNEAQRFAQEAMLTGLGHVDRRQGYYGPLGTVPKEGWEERLRGFDEVLDRLGGRALERSRLYVGLVTEVSRAKAKVRLGSKLEGELPLGAARWAREPNSEAYFPSALIDTLVGTLRPGDLILVRASHWKDVGMESEHGGLKRAYGDDLFLALEQEPKLQGAIVSLDPWSGYVVAMIGGYDFDASEFNRAFQACRQPGSAFKPIVYSANFEFGKDPMDPTGERPFTAASILIDAPIVADDLATNRRWKPQNYGMNFEGEVTAARALMLSMNIPAVKVMENIGIRDTVDWAYKIGITSTLNEDFSIALGSSCVTLWDLAKVYATFDRLGTPPKTTFLRRVEDRFGRTLEDHTWYADGWAPLYDRVLAGYAALHDEREQLVSQEAAFITTDLLRNITLYGTAARAGYLHKYTPVAGKTGTTNDSFDAWFMGFSRDVVTGVWVGYDRYDQEPMGRYENGGRAALPIWMEYMENVLAGRPKRDWPIPHGMGHVLVDTRTGKAVAPGAEGARALPFKWGTEPKRELPGSSGGLDLFLGGPGLGGPGGP